MYFEIQNSNVRLAGSMHVLPAGVDCPPWVWDAYAWSEQIVLEADTNDVGRFAFLPPGENTLDTLPRDLHLQLTSVWPSSGPFGALGTQRLWIVLTVLALNGLRVDHGVENRYRARMQSDPREIRFLESVADLATAIESVGIEALTAAVRTLLSDPIDDRAQRLVTMYAAWLSRDVTQVDALIETSPLGQFAVLRDSIFRQRNRSWAPRIAELLRTDKRTLIVVGAGHLPGSDGLLALLSEIGCRSTSLS